MDLQTLKTPSLVLDLDRVKQNARRMTERVGSLRTKLRPHVKTHKCVEVARLQVAGNSGSIAVSTLAEGAIFAANEFADIMYAIPIEPGKFSECIQLSRQCDRLLLITDDIAVPRMLNDAARQARVKLSLLLDVDCGYGRTGVKPRTKNASEIVRGITHSTNLRFSGLLTHAGQSYHARSPEELLTIAQQERDVMIEFAGELRRSSLEVPWISIGSTPTITAVDHLNGIDEARPGNYIFFDAFQATLGTCGFENCAITVLTAVVSRDRDRRQVVFDAGAIALSKDRGPLEFDPQCGYGRILDLEGNDLGIRMTALSQEHGLANVTDKVLLDRLKIGSRVRVLPNHSCLAAAQHDCYHILERGEIVDRWQRCRGW